MIRDQCVPSKIAGLAVASIAAACIALPSAARAEPVQWKMTGVISSGAVFTKHLDAISGGAFKITTHKPGTLFPHFELFKAIGKGRVDLGMDPIGFWSKTIPAAPLFSAVPFGPEAPEYLAWIYHGGGQKILEDIVAPHGIHPIICEIGAPEASGWFRKEIKWVDDFKGLKMRFFGLGAQVMKKLGVETQLLPPSKILAALESGELDATEFASPDSDFKRGFHKVAKHYYFPGWHQPYTLLTLMINKDRWAALSATQKAQIKAACSANLVARLAEEGAQQPGALQKLQDEGVQLHRWSPEMLAVFKKGWDEVAAEMSEKDPDFKRAWTSLSAFREKYKIWDDLALVD
ncbi:MAG: TRAP transporter substrate-binding protein [Methyloligellaceae bacterium]